MQELLIAIAWCCVGVAVMLIGPENEKITPSSLYRHVEEKSIIHTPVIFAISSVVIYTFYMIIWPVVLVWEIMDRRNKDGG